MRQSTIQLTTEHNCLVAEFMGSIKKEAKSNEQSFARFKDYLIPEKGYYDKEDLLYHDSFEWIMPVVIKINEMGYDFTMSNNQCYISEGTPQGDGGKYFNVIVETDNPSGIINTEFIWLTAVRFIQWYNYKKSENV